MSLPMQDPSRLYRSGWASQLLAEAIGVEIPKLLSGLRVQLGRREMAMLEIDNHGFGL